MVVTRFLTAIFAFAIVAASAQVQRPQLKAVQRETSGWFTLAVDGPENAAYEVYSSSNLNNWNSIATLLPGWNYVDPILPFVDARPSSEARYYQVRATEVASQNDWKNQVYYPDDLFRSESILIGLPEVRWIKFAITTNEPSRVYFQDSIKYKFHYDFAAARLAEFKGMSPAEFDRISLRTNDQHVVLGTVLFAPVPEMQQAAIQFVGMDAYPPEQIADWFEVVRAAILPRENLQVLYIPTYEQAAAAEGNRAYFEARGISVGTLETWQTGEDVYSLGWAVGLLKFFPQSEVMNAYASGILKPGDILLTDAVPAEMPFLSGILTLSPATPNSHVAILARSYGVPFGYLADTALRTRATALVGKEVVVTAKRGYPSSVIELIDVSAMKPAAREELIALKKPAPLNIVPTAHLGRYTEVTDAFTPADIRYFGGKAANFGFLRREIPEDSPQAIAISFDLWADFMSQQIGAQTLQQIIQQRLGQHSYPPNVGALQQDLAFIRDLIEDETQFTTAQQDSIKAALLERFDPQRKIRFRSSTNVEDSENFTGAGLYDSYSGCLADDLDGDSGGPSACDPDEPRERGVFRAIRKVYASFFNDNAVLERMRHNVPESQVGMAILVHYSTPDPFEWANGVATVNFQRQSTFRSYNGTMVTQKGAVSVTNPDNSAVPEVVDVSKFFDTPFPETKQWSSLVPLGGHVLEWQKEYIQFMQLFERVAAGFEKYYPAKQNYTLDFEYKKIEPGNLRVKQVRQIPTPPANARIGTYLVNDRKDWWVFQGEYSDVFANHRLKSQFALGTRNFAITSNNLESPIYEEIKADYIVAGALQSREGHLSTFPNAQHRMLQTPFSTLSTADSWREAAGVTYQLTTHLPHEVAAGESPIVTLAGARVEFAATYDAPQLTLGFDGQPATTTEDIVVLAPIPTTNANSIFVVREAATNDVQIRIEFYWPEPPRGVAAGYTAPLQKWHQTTILGLTSEPIVLRGYYSQTYRPEHHNFGENFLFEPRLEPGLSSALLEELEGKQIRQILVYWGGQDNPSRLHLIDPDNQLRPVPRN